MNKLHDLNSHPYKRIIYMTLILLFASVPAHATYQCHEKCDNLLTVPLLIEDNTQVGVVTVTHRKNTLKIKYFAWKGWKISKTHLAADTLLDTIPTDNNGNPQIKRFPNKTRHRTGVDSVTHYISTKDIALGTKLFIAAHAELKHQGRRHYSTSWSTTTDKTYTRHDTYQKAYKINFSQYFTRHQSKKSGKYCKKKDRQYSKTRSHNAWAKGDPFYGDQKAYYFTYTLQSCQDKKESTIQLENTLYTVDEDAGSVILTIIRDGDLSEGASVKFSTYNGTATEGLDYGQVNEIIQFMPNVASVDVEVPIIDDSDDEMTETINAQLTNVQGASLGNQTNAVVEIIDNDDTPIEPDVITFSDINYHVNERDGFATITVIRTGTLEGTVSVNFSTLPTSFPSGNATAGADYTPVSGTLEFPPGIDTLTFDVPVRLDRVTLPFEPEVETVLLQLDLPVDAVLGNPSDAILNIQDSSAGQN